MNFLYGDKTLFLVGRVIQPVFKFSGFVEQPEVISAGSPQQDAEKLVAGHEDCIGRNLRNTFFQKGFRRFLIHYDFRKSCLPCRHQEKHGDDKCQVLVFHRFLADCPQEDCEKENDAQYREAEQRHLPGSRRPDGMQSS